MELVQTVITSLVVAVVGGLVTLAMTGQFRSLRREMDARFGTVDARLGAVDRRFDAVDRRFDAVDARFDAIDRRFERDDARFERLDSRLDSSFDSLRSDITQIALAVGARPRAQND
jgi:hypothetical protein